ncbi:13781_t:CDS:2, partial [Funneliformis geosporum]
TSFISGKDAEMISEKSFENDKNRSSILSSNSKPQLSTQKGKISKYMFGIDSNAGVKLEICPN